MLEWWTATALARRGEILAGLAGTSPLQLVDRIESLAAVNDRVHTRDAINLNPATNTMNPRAEALLAGGLGTRPTLGHPGEKYEMGLEAIEEIEVITGELARRVFTAGFAEVRVPSGAMANLYAFMATCRPGDAIIVPPATIGGHVTHNAAGCAGLYGLEIHEAPVDPARYTVDPARVAVLAGRVQPRLITVGQSLNLERHPVAELREVADRVGAHLLFDAAHACGMIAGGAWPNPLSEGAHIMSMSTYKSLGGPPGGLLFTDDAGLAERLDSIAFPGMTANFDVAKTAALGVTLTDWIECGTGYATAMIETAAALARSLDSLGVPIFTTTAGPTTSHQFAVDARRFGGGTALARRLRIANLLTSAIGLPSGADDGLRLGTPEMARWGMTVDEMPELAELIAIAMFEDPSTVAGRSAAMRRRFRELRFVIGAPGPRSAGGSVAEG